MELSEVLYAVLLGVIQGITEFLPVSSSAHLIVVSTFFDGKPLSIHLNIALHIGTLLAVLIYFWRDWLKLVKACGHTLKTRELSFESKILFPSLILGSIPAGIIGILWQDDIEGFFHNPKSTIIPLAVVGVLMWIVDLKMKRDRPITQMKYRHAWLIGLFQAIALIPGVSRSGITILAGRLVHIDKEDAARFSFMLGTPAMAGAALLNFDEIVGSLGQIEFYVGLLTSMVVGCLAIRFLLSFLRRYGFAAFAGYRILLAIVLTILLF